MLALGNAQREMVLAGGGCRHMVAKPSQCEPFITDLWNYICTLSSMAALQKPAQAFANPGTDHGCHLSTSASASSLKNKQTQPAAQETHAVGSSPVRATTTALATSCRSMQTVARSSAPSAKI